MCTPVSLKHLDLTKGKIDGAVNDLKLISGQQPVITKARKSVAGFKLREGVNVGPAGKESTERLIDWPSKTHYCEDLALRNKEVSFFRNDECSSLGTSKCPLWEQSNVLSGNEQTIEQKIVLLKNDHASCMKTMNC